MENYKSNLFIHNVRVNQIVISMTITRHESCKAIEILSLRKQNIQTKKIGFNCHDEMVFGLAARRQMSCNQLFVNEIIIRYSREYCSAVVSLNLAIELNRRFNTNFTLWTTNFIFKDLRYYFIFKSNIFAWLFNCYTQLSSTNRMKFIHAHTEKRRIFVKLMLIQRK